jgi:putative cardiolipin synthase
MGVNLYEVRANTSIPADVSAGVQEAKSTLHAKAFVVDRQRVYIGSFNWNQRSLNLDTELGVIIYSPELATRMLDRVNTALPAVAFEVFLDEKDRIRWRYTDNGQEVIVSKEPQSGFWRRFSAGFMRMLPIKSQL